MGLKKDAAEKGLEVATDLVKNNATNVLGMLFPFAGVKKKAVEMYMEDIEKSDLPKETKYGLLLNMKKEFKRLKNQKAVAQIALDNAKEGTDFSEKSGVNEEWFERYMDAAKFVSSEDMQLIWGKILAGEFEKPGSTPPNMIRILSEMTPELAKDFSIICCMTVSLREIKGNGFTDIEQRMIIVPYNHFRNFCRTFGLGLRVLSELDALGVIKLNSKGYKYRASHRRKILIYVEKKFEIIESNTWLPTGNVFLTSVGESLRRIIQTFEIDCYNEMVKEYMLENGVKFEDKNDYIIEKNEDTYIVIKKNK